MTDEIKLVTTDLTSVQEAAKALGRSRVTIYRWIARHTLLSVKLGGIYYVPVSEVERLKLETEKKGGKQE